VSVIDHLEAKKFGALRPRISTRRVGRGDVQRPERTKKVSKRNGPYVTTAVGGWT